MADEMNKQELSLTDIENVAGGDSGEACRMVNFSAVKQ